jgi:Holliday junction resolvase RusA-like endonuclease
MGQTATNISQGFGQRNREIEITVYGIPGPQGSKRHVGSGVMIESSKKVKPWREAVKWAFVERYGGSERPGVSGPVSLEVVFTLARPKSTKRDRPSVKPDLSKLVRSTEDALTDIGAWEDDARVVVLMASKRYAGSKGALASPGAMIRIREAA